MTTSIVWFRHDLRLHDNPALAAALQNHRNLLPVYIYPGTDHDWAIGSASRWWLHHSLDEFSRRIERLGSRLVIRRGQAENIIPGLAKKLAVSDIYVNAVYEPAAARQDAALEAGLQQAGITLHRIHGNLIKPPAEVMNKSNAAYRVFTPFYRFYLQNGFSTGITPSPQNLPGIDDDIDSEPLDSLGLLPANDWYKKLSKYWQPGEAGAQKQLTTLTAEKLAAYPGNRDLPAVSGTSRLSPHLHFGEISPRQVIMHADQLAASTSTQAVSRGHEALVRQLIWRDFAIHILHHFPHTTNRPFLKQYEKFPWSHPDPDFISAWQQGRTGIPIIDAGMRELWETGWMHNRVRMIVASLLTKNARQHWTEGAHWFWDTLVDADLANNTMGWQWVAGCGVDAAPYFRIFNPVSQSRKFDPDGEYLRRWLPELASLPLRHLHEPWATPEDVLEQAGITLGEDYPYPVIDIASSRKETLDAYNAFRTSLSAVED